MLNETDFQILKTGITKLAAIFSIEWPATAIHAN
jgi:hypothetical protein